VAFDRESVIRQIQLETEWQKRQCERSLEAFCKAAWHIIEPGTPLIWNWHLSTICGYLEAFHRNELPDKRLIINIPPGTLKSILVSVMYPAWTWIKESHLRYLCITNEQGLAIRDALRMKQVITSDWFQTKWPLALKADQNEKTLYSNDKLGFRQSQGITASNTGKRGDCLLLDDLIDSKHAFSDVIRQSVNDTWDQSLSSRLNHPDKSGVLLIMQRLHEADIAGHLLKKVKSKWTVLAIPMRYEGFKTFDAGKDIGRPELNDPRTKPGELLFGNRFSERAVESLEEDLGEYGSAGQLQQRPSPLGGGIIKKHWWRVWPDDKAIPEILHVFHSYDTAFSERDMKDAAFSACTRWGIFWHEQRQKYCILALGIWFDRVAYEELRKHIKEQDKKHKPDINLIEKKATGISIIQDMKKATPGRVRAYSPGKGEDKVSRVHSVSPLIEAGMVFVPNKVWAIGNGKDKLGLIDYVASFPSGAPPCADITDTVTQALIYLRSGNWTSDLEADEEEELPISRASEEELEDMVNDKVIYYG